MSKKDTPKKKEVRNHPLTQSFASAKIPDCKSLSKRNREGRPHKFHS